MRLSLALLCSVIVAIGNASAANAECKISSPNVMYLGTNATYDISLELGVNDLCSLNFVEKGERVTFQLLKTEMEPTAGTLERISDFVIYFKPGKAVREESFALKLCGTDSAGSGCSLLRYKATVN